MVVIVFLALSDEAIAKLEALGFKVITKATSVKSDSANERDENIEPELGSVEEGKVICRERLGGLLRYYHRDAV